MWVVCSSSPCDLPHHHHPLQCPRHPRGVWPRPVNKNIRCTNPFSSPLPPSQPHRDPLERPPLNIDLNSHTERQSSRSSGWGRHEGDTNKWWPVLCQINPRPVCLILWVSLSVGPYVRSWSWPDRPRGFYLTTESHSSSAVSSCCTHNTSATEYILLAT